MQKVTVGDSLFKSLEKSQIQWHMNRYKLKAHFNVHGIVKGSLVKIIGNYKDTYDVQIDHLILESDAGEIFYLVIDVDYGNNEAIIVSAPRCEVS